MNWFNNFRIRTKLLAGFGAVITLVMVLAVYAVVQVGNINDQYHNVINHPVVTRDAILRTQSNIRAFRRTVAGIVMYAPTNDISAISTLIQEGLGFLDDAFLALDDYEYAVRTNRDLSEADINERVANSAELRSVLQAYHDDIFIPVRDYALAGNHTLALAQVESGNAEIEQLVSITFSLAYTAEHLMNTKVQYAFSLADTSFTVLIIVAAAIVIAAVFLALFVAHAIAKPIKTLVSLTGSVSMGRLNVNIDRSKITKDEIGDLTRDVYGLVDIIRNIVDDLTQIDHQFNIVGDIDYRADAGQYQNSFKEVIESVNNILSNQIKDTLGTIDVLNKIADGDFDVHVDDLPGKKMILPRTLRVVTANLKEIYGSALYLAENVASGNLNVEIDQTKFKGSWAELVRTLDNLVAAVSDPLTAIEFSLNALSRGDFTNARIEKTFEGTFENVKNALNTTEKITSSYIGEISNVLEHMSWGDLSVSARLDYIGAYAPIKIALITILESLNDTISEIQSAVEQVALGAGQISASAMTLAEGATRQTASIEELSSSIAIIHEKATEASASAVSAKEGTERSQEHVFQGSGSVSAMTDTMHKIKASSEGIAKIVDVITGIAFQTNLLALNASVEAARAGEHGKGFSVVADEVRTLAGRSQQSTTDTMTIIDEDVKNVEEGINAAEEVVSSFETISNNISGIAGLITHIADISEEQLSSISIINASVTEIADVVTGTSATAEESAAASQELNSQAEMLRQKVAFFRLKAV